MCKIHVKIDDVRNLGGRMWGGEQPASCLSMATRDVGLRINEVSRAGCLIGF